MYKIHAYKKIKANRSELFGVIWRQGLFTQNKVILTGLIAWHLLLKFILNYCFYLAKRIYGSFSLNFLHLCISLFFLHNFLAIFFSFLFSYWPLTKTEMCVRLCFLIFTFLLHFLFLFFFPLPKICVYDSPGNCQAFRVNFKHLQMSRKFSLQSIPA